MVALDSVRENTRRRRTYGKGADAGVILIIRGLVIFRTCGFKDIADKLLRLWLIVLRTIPW
jgi:hypothetical protein